MDAASSPTGLADAAVSLGLLLGHNQPLLPARIRRLTLDRQRLRVGLRRRIPVIAWLDRWLRPRASGFLCRPATRIVGLAGLLNAALIVLPIPFGNVTPSIAMLILALGLVVGDGLAVAAGLSATIAALVVDVGLVVLGYAALVALVEAAF